MTTKNSDTIFSAVLTPNRSLSPRGFVILMGLVSLISFSAGLVFLLMGAWPVFGFFGLDVLLIYLAFKWNYRSGRLHELVDLKSDTLMITRVYPSGKSRSWQFNPYWVRLELIDKDAFRVDLSLSSHGKKLVFGSFLSEDEKKDFAAALGDALSACRTGAPAE